MNKIYLDEDRIEDDGMFPKKVLTPREQKEKTRQMIEAIRQLSEDYPGRLIVDCDDDDDLIRVERTEVELDPISGKPLQKLQLDIETDLSLLALGKTIEMKEPPAHGYIVVQYRVGDFPDEEWHLHFQTVEEVIAYIKLKIAPN